MTAATVSPTHDANAYAEIPATDKTRKSSSGA
jgi:hypothetical protein